MRFHPENYTGRNLLLLGTTAATIGTASLLATRMGETTEEYPVGTCIPGQHFLTPDAPPSDDPIRNLQIRIYEKLLANPAYGSYLERNTNGDFQITECPEVLSIQFIPLYNFPNENKITIYRNPDLTVETHFVAPQDIKTRSGVRVSGKPFPLHEFGRIWIVNNDGKTYPGGLWIMLTDLEGSPIYPTNGRVLERNEGAYYVPARVVNPR